MKVKLAKSAGFCMGVRRALDMALISSHIHKGPLYTIGPIIHNPQVIEFLERKGLHALKDGERPPPGSKVIIRAHGISPKKASRLEKLGLEIIDATCPRVKAVQKIIERESQKGRSIVIVGDKEHPEVVALMGYARGKACVVKSPQDVEAMPIGDGPVSIVAQTTMDEMLYNEIVSLIKGKVPSCEVFNTICASTHVRQEEVRALASQVDAMVIVGGKNSANTKRLAKICSEEMGKPTFHVETDLELDLEALSKYEVIGVTAGASTPNWIIKRVVQKIRGMPWILRIRPMSWLVSLWRLLILTHLYLGLAGAALTLTSCLLARIEPKVSYLIISAGYLSSMHLFNRYAEDVTRKFNDPVRAEFYEGSARVLLPMGGVALLVSILAGLSLGWVTMLAVMMMSFLGLLYSVPLFPAGWKGFSRKTLKDIPCSKTISVALAWGVVSCILPALHHRGESMEAVLVVFLFASTMAFIRSAQVDILDIQGDRILGRETLPVLLGERGTKIWMAISLVLVSALLMVTSLMGLIPALGAWIAASGIYTVFYLRINLQEFHVDSAFYEGIVDTHFILMGLISLLWWWRP